MYIQLVKFNVVLHVVAPQASVSPNQTFSLGDTSSLNCTGRGGPDNFYQWQFNGEDILGENSTVLTLSIVNASIGGEYSCVVTNRAGNNTASTFVFISPYFVTQPVNTEGSNGSAVNLTCRAEAFPEPEYQWGHIDGAAIRDHIMGTNSTTLIFTPFMFGDEGQYYCNVTASGRTIQSDSITLTSKM